MSRFEEQAAEIMARSWNYPGLMERNPKELLLVFSREVMKFFVLMGLAMASAFCMSQTTLPETEKALEKKPGSSESAAAQTPPKTGFEPALPSLLDNEFAWDQFKHRTTLIWACRGTKTGKIVANSYCASQPMVDSRWPDKKTPGDYRGVLIF